MFGRDLFFGLPQAAFFLLLLLPLIYGQWQLWRHRAAQQALYTPAANLPALLTPRAPLFTLTKILGWLFIWILACVALMDPFGHVRYPSTLPPASKQIPKQPHYVPHEIIFLVDTSASMRVADGYEGQTRLDSTKTIMEDVMRQLKGQTVSLYTFTSELFSVVPPTLDYLFVRLAIKDLHINQGDVEGTRFGPVLAALQKEAFPEPAPKLLTIIMLTDGGDTQLETLKGEARTKEEESIVNTIAHPQQLHLRLFPIGMGGLKDQAIPDVTFHDKPVLSKLEPAILQKLAAKERGTYYMAQEWTSWNLAQELIKQLGDDPIKTDNKAFATEEQAFVPVKQSDMLFDLYYQIPLGLALLFYLFNFLLPNVHRL